jgi:hypothetical protein
VAVCPYCVRRVDVDGDREQIRHMQEVHADVVAQRMRDAGFTRDRHGRWVDRTQMAAANAVRSAARLFPPRPPGSRDAAPVDRGQSSA